MVEVNTKKPTVCVIMSTFNGEKYIKQQIESIFSQAGINVDLYIRDDGSNDKTVLVIKDMMAKNPRIRLTKGTNIGYAKSFLTLLRIVDGYDYYAFSDQDDVWKPEKLYEAIKTIGNNCNPQIDLVCYWCNLALVDEKLSFIRDMKPARIQDFDKGRYLIDKYGYGCTMVITSALKHKATRVLPEHNISHDNWIGLTAVFLGKPIYDSRTLIKYRQHQNNVVGGQNGFFDTWKRRLKCFSHAKEYSRANVAFELLRCYSEDLQTSDKDLLIMVKDYKKSVRNKLALFFDKRTQRASFEKNIIFRIEILLSLA